jgi:hypothetical protein
VGGRSTAWWDLALGRGGEGGWSSDAAKEVGPGTEMVTESAQGSSRGHGRKEAQWEEGAGEPESGVGERPGKEWGRDAEEGRRERRLGGWCRHRSCAQ